MPVQISPKISSISVIINTILLVSRILCQILFHFNIGNITKKRARLVMEIPIPCILQNLIKFSDFLFNPLVTYVIGIIIDRYIIIRLMGNNNSKTWVPIKGSDVPIIKA